MGYSIGHGVFLKMVGVKLRVDVLGVGGSRVMYSFLNNGLMAKRENHKATASAEMASLKNLLCCSVVTFMA